MPDETPESSPAVEQPQAEPQAPPTGIFDPEPEKTAPAEQKPEEAATPETTEPEGEKPEDESVSAPEAAKRPEGKAEARIRQLTAKIRAMERQAQEAQSRPQQPPAPQQLAAPTKPKLDQFETIEAYDSALEKWKDETVKYETSIAVERERQQRVYQAQQEALEKHNREVAGNWQKRMETFSKSIPDLSEAIKDGAEGLIPRNPTIDGFILDSDVGPAILHELWKNPEEAEKIAAMTPYKCVRAMHDLELRVSQKAKGINPRPSTVKPVPHAGGKAASTPSKPKTMEEIIYG